MHVKSRTTLLVILLGVLLVVRFAPGGQASARKMRGAYLATAVHGLAGASGLRAAAQVCITDALEPNDSQVLLIEQGVLLEAGDYNGLYLCAGEEDWFAVDVPAGFQLRYKFDLPTSGISYSPAFYDANGSLLPSTLLTDGWFGYIATQAQTVYLLLRHDAGNPAAYNLHLRLECPRPE